MRIIEFFEDADGRLSMSRLLVFLTFGPATYLVLQNPDELTTYLGAFVINYGVGKVSDVFTARSQVLEAASDSAGANGAEHPELPDGVSVVRKRTARTHRRGF